jgi:hypothetical protein
MKTNLACAAFLTLFALPLAGQEWSVGVGTGPFVFGDFVERRLRPVNSEGSEEPMELALSAGTRAGLSVDVQHAFADRWAVRLEGTFTRAPLAIKDDRNELEFDAGEIDVATLMLPIVFRINPRSALRFHVMGGPAYAMYETSAPASSGSISLSNRTSNEWGIAFGGGAAWWLSDRFAIEGNLSDTITTSPFSEMDDDETPGITVKKPHNVHTTIGVRWRL